MKPQFSLRDLGWFVLVVAAALGGYCWRNDELATLREANQEWHAAWSASEDKLARTEMERNGAQATLEMVAQQRDRLTGREVLRDEQERNLNRAMLEHLIHWLREKPTSPEDGEEREKVRNIIRRLAREIT